MSGPSFVERLLRQPHAILTFTLVVVLGGVIAYRTLPMNLFPDTNRPMVTVVTRWPGAASDDVATEVTHPIEVRLSGIDGVRRVTSVSRDQVSAVTAEFEYGNDIDMAATRVANELPRVRGRLPAGAGEPMIFKITDAARPVTVLAVTAAPGTGLDLGRLRWLAENPLRDRLLAIPGVAEAEVFGGEVRQVSVDLDRDRLQAHHLSVAQVATALLGSNLSLPAGHVYRDGERLVLTATHLAHLPDDLAAVLVELPGGGHVRVGDLGTVHWGAQDATSLYRGNGKPAVAVSLLRAEGGFTSRVVAAIDRALPAVRAAFPMVRIEVADTQGRLIHISVSNMLDALRDAVVMTLVVILLFLGNSRAAFVTAVSLPFSYLLTFAVIKLMGYEFNLVTLTAVIIAVGLLADDAIVVIENIERRMRTQGESGLAVAVAGTQEILLADMAGTISTVIVLVPVMFVGGYVQTVLRPLTMTLSVSLFASLIVSVTLIPRLVPWLLRPGARDPLGFLLRPFDRFVLEPTRSLYIRIVRWGLDHRLPVLAVLALLFVASARQMPLVGRELMPRMDTGIFLVNFEAAPDTDEHRMARLAAAVEAAVRAEVEPAWIESMSTVVGSEAGVKSFGAARTLQQGQTTVNLVDRFHRDRSIYAIERGVRARLHRIPGLIAANVTEFGATPLSSIRGTVDVMLTGPDPAVLDRLADQVMARLRTVRGLTGVERSWQGNERRLRLQVEPEAARLYGLTSADVARQVAAQVGGTSGGRLRVTGQNPIPIWVRLRPEQRSDPESLEALRITTRAGSQVPLAAVAKVVVAHTPTAETHQALLPTVDVLGYRGDIDVVHLHQRVVRALRGLELPRGYRLSYEGEIKQMGESFGRLGRSFLLGVALLYLMLVITFRSFLDAVAIIATLPLAIIGASWAMLIAGKHGCMPSFMGLILLMGIIVNNGILLVDFARVAMARGTPRREALLQAVSLRTRPILMTAAASAVGMVPIALEWAVGIERLSPLAVVAIGGLVAGTFLTLLVVPVLFDLLESARGWGLRASRQ
ncbi:MAG: efflux RND transporter permease subunit [Nitrospirae bacterium]|nr:MAG: efflux RND transporter permease subunit [Nitrospirota bacterium]